MVVAKFATTTLHGAIEGKTQTHMTEYYNLDVIISVGYRVKSRRGVAFRKWANSVLKQYIFIYLWYNRLNVAMSEDCLDQNYLLRLPGFSFHYINSLMHDRQYTHDKQNPSKTDGICLHLCYNKIII